MMFLLFSLVVGLCSGRPQSFKMFNPNQFQSSDPIEDLSQGVHGLANGARATAVIVEQGGGAGVDILTQFGQLFGKFSWVLLSLKWVNLESVSSQSQSLVTRTRGLQSTNGEQINESSFTLEDMGKLLRGSAIILDNNAPRLREVANQAALEA